MVETASAALFLDVRKLNTADLAAILVEERKGKNEERIKPYRTWIGFDGGTPFPVGTETELKRKEMDGVRSVQTLARKGCKTIVWISPPGGMSRYEEARMIVYEVESVEETRVNFKCVAVCSQHNPDKCVDIGNAILDDGGVSCGEIVEPDDLRSEPIGLSGDVIDWVTYLENTVPGLPEVWEAIRSGKHEDNARAAWEMADIVVRQFRRRAASVNSRVGAVMLGVEIERMISHRFDIRLMAGGVHGMSNQAVMGQMGSFDASYRMGSGETDKRLQKCGRCGNYYMKKKEKCPSCSV